jgi:hypothetical protein
VGSYPAFSGFFLVPLCSRMKTIRIITVLLLPAIGMLSQNYVKGYVITEKGDSINGEIKFNPKKEYDVYVKLPFKDANGAQKNYKPEKVKRYGIENRQFSSFEEGGEFRFFEALAKGDISLFKTVTEATRMNETSFEPEYYLMRSDKKLVDVKETKFRKQIAEWMKDQPEIAEEYPDEKKFDPEKAVLVIRHYNSIKTGK